MDDVLINQCPYNFNELEPYLHDLLVVAGHIEALLWFLAFWLIAWLLYRLIRVFV